MTTAQLNKQICDIVEQKVEQKLLEFFGDPDEGLELKKSFITELKKSMKEKNRKLTSHVDVLKMYGLR